MWETDTSTTGTRLVNTPLGILELTDDDADRLVAHLSAELDPATHENRYVCLTLDEAWIDVTMTDPTITFHDAEFEIGVPMPWEAMAELAALIEGSPAYVTRYGDQSEYEVRWHHDQHDDGTGCTFYVSVDDTDGEEGCQLPPMVLTPWQMTKLVRGLTQASA